MACTDEEKIEKTSLKTPVRALKSYVLDELNSEQA